MSDNEKEYSLPWSAHGRVVRDFEGDVVCKAPDKKTAFFIALAANSYHSDQQRIALLSKKDGEQ